MHRLVIPPLAPLLLSLFGLGGCSSLPAAPEKPDGLMRITINDPALVAEVMSQYYRSLTPPHKPVSTISHVVTRTLGETLERHVPADYQIYVNPEIDLNQTLQYDETRPWTESLGEPLSDAGIDMTANLDKKVMGLTLADMTIRQVIDRYLPADFTVFTEDFVNLGTVVKYDRRLPWAEAFGKALAPIGIGFIANMTTRIIQLRQKAASIRQISKPPDTTPSETLANLQALAPSHAD